MRCSTAAARVLLASAALLACGGVNDPNGEPSSAPSLLAGANSGGAAGQAPGSSSNPTGTAPPSEAGQGGMESSSNLPATLATGGAGGDDSLAAPTFCDAPAKLLVPSCGDGSCHSNGAATIGDFAADAQRAYNFVDKVSARHAECGRIIDSRDYSKSLLLVKIRGEFDSPYCGGRMPVGSFVITEDQVDCLASWLQQFQK